LSQVHPRIRRPSGARLIASAVISSWTTTPPTKHPGVANWLAKHKRFRLHFTPTSSSWLNLVERWFRELTYKNIRRGSFPSVPDLIASIEDYLWVNNEHPKPLVWTATAEVASHSTE
jgi:hypothetical protein